MNSKSKLESLLVESEDLNLINIVSVPRSMSTMLGRLLCQGAEGSIFINEPFNRNNIDIELASERILESIDKLGSYSGKKQIVLKNMATYLTDEAFSFITELSHKTIYSVRDPIFQIGSLVTRMANDLACGTGSDKLKENEVELYLDDVVNLLLESNLSENFSRTGWRDLRRHFDNYNEQNNIIISDGNNLTNNPTMEIPRLCEKLGIVFCDAMVSGWENGFDNWNTQSSIFNTKINAWTKDAATNIGVVKNDRKPIDMNKLPSALVDHIYDTALPAYRYIKGDA